jgi:hypothetical protein
MRNDIISTYFCDKSRIGAAGRKINAVYDEASYATRDQIQSIAE